jgi:HSP20 family protein
MTAPRWNPIRLRPDQLPLLRLDEQIDKAFDALLSAPWLGVSAGWTPQIDVFETTDAFLVEADLPGVTLENLQVRVDGDEVTICGTRSETRREESSQGVVRIERRH